MKTLQKKYAVLTLFLLCAVGTLDHFAYDLCHIKYLKAVLGYVCPVSGIIFEHVKMVWFPMIAMGIILSLLCKNRGYFGAAVIAGAAAIFGQLGLFAFYESFTGHAVVPLDVSLYYVNMIYFALVSFQLAKRKWIEKTLFLWIAAAVIISLIITYLSHNPGHGYVFLNNKGLAGIGDNMYG